jgi:5-formyltetrahydrofolate cyclo-ligase
VTDAVADAKQAARQQVWDALEAAGAAEPGVHGTIPAFVGAEAAADRLATLPAWQNATVIKAVPDRAQLPVRVRALTEGKTVYMAVPKMADIKPFYHLDPNALTPPFDEVATGRGAAGVAPKVGTDDMPPIDLIICGSVVVNRKGTRVGKGAGYSDLEFALLQEAGLISDHTTTIITTVHALQVVEDDLPETDHDFSVDLIVTADGYVECGAPRRPPGLVWDQLDAGKVAAIPALAERWLSRHN